MGVDFQTLDPMQLYRASDALMAHREAIEHHLFDRAMDLFDLHPTVTLYDLTNTYFEGEARGQPKARRGHSKEKRTDCPLLTLGLVLDASGFVRRSQVFAGTRQVRPTSPSTAPRRARPRTGEGSRRDLRAPPAARRGYVPRGRRRRSRCARRIQLASRAGARRPARPLSSFNWPFPLRRAKPYSYASPPYARLFRHLVDTAASVTSKVSNSGGLTSIRARVSRFIAGNPAPVSMHHRFPRRSARSRGSWTATT